jgi:thiaminase/transcriptional activator TenA
LAEPKPSADHPYRDWITTYGSTDFEQLAARIEALLDQTASDTPAVRAAYRYAMECELAFFAAPLVPQRC